MQSARIVNLTRGVVVADRVECATSFWARARGLIGRKSLPAGFALVIKSASSVHSAMMSVAIDVAHAHPEGHPQGRGEGPDLDALAAQVAPGQVFADAEIGPAAA